MRRFFAAPINFSAKEVELSVDESKHLRDVLRLRASEVVSVFDGVGNEFLCSIEPFDRRTERIRLLLHEKIESPVPESNLELTLAVALLKGEKFDLVVQKAVELGVKAIVPLTTKRADIRLNDEKDAAKKIERWQRIAIEAAKQSGRAALPKIETPVSFDKFLVSKKADEIGVLFAERGGLSFHQNLPNEITNLTAIIGAEGGWEDFEIEAARAQNFFIAKLGRRILRAETAAIAVAVLFQHLYGDLS